MCPYENKVHRSRLRLGLQLGLGLTRTAIRSVGLTSSLDTRSTAACSVLKGKKFVLNDKKNFIAEFVVWRCVYWMRRRTSGQ